MTRTSTVEVWPPPGRLGIVGFFALFGALIGAWNGLLFALVVAAAERGRSAATLRVWRMGLWGAFASGGIAGVVFREPPLALVMTALGFGAGASMAYLARRSARAAESRAVSG